MNVCSQQNAAREVNWTLTPVCKTQRVCGVQTELLVYVDVFRTV